MPAANGNRVGSRGAAAGNRPAPGGRRHLRDLRRVVFPSRRHPRLRDRDLDRRGHVHARRRGRALRGRCASSVASPDCRGRHGAARGVVRRDPLELGAPVSRSFDHRASDRGGGGSSPDAAPSRARLTTTSRRTATAAHPSRSRPANGLPPDCGNRTRVLTALRVSQRRDRIPGPGATGILAQTTRTNVGRTAERSSGRTQSTPPCRRGVPSEFSRP